MDQCVALLVGGDALQSCSNRSEAAAVAKVVRRLMAAGVEPQSIGVICFYRAQVRTALRECLLCILRGRTASLYRSLSAGGIDSLFVGGRAWGHRGGWTKQPAGDRCHRGQLSGRVFCGCLRVLLFPGGDVQIAVAWTWKDRISGSSAFRRAWRRRSSCCPRPSPAPPPSPGTRSA